MITAFVAPFAPPPLPHLDIMDNTSEESVPVGGLEGWDADYLQTQTITFAPLAFIDLGEFTTDGDSSVFWCQRLSKAIAKIAFSVSAATVDVRAIWYDSFMNEIVSDVTTLTATLRTDGDGYYMAPAFEFDLNGAARIGLAFESISSGSVYAKLAGV
ncbi:MAG: hypothetical protein B7C24_16575 [Bacteroidetes bacterium 4572_77]|nr:MAG: hypothetical protein B7C24_16575 [Bacteroidetes bacterium 4572_77]